MNRFIRAAVLFLGLAALVGALTPTPGQGQEKKDEKKDDKKKDTKKAKWAPVVEFTAKAPKAWFLVEPKPGIKMVSDKDYIVISAPNEVAGSTYLVRSAADHGQWFPDGTLKAKKDVTVYAIVRVRYNNKDVFNDTAQAQFVKDGWAEVDGKTATTFPGKENWEWKTWKKEIKEGEITLPLASLKWPGTGVLFFFK